MSGVPGQSDEQQAQLVERLRAADGAPVSFDELRAIGIENPALLCYELAAVGLPVIRSCSTGEGMPALSVRLEPEREQQRADPEVSCTQRSDPEQALDALAPMLSTQRRALDAAAARALGRLTGARVSAERLGLRARRAARDMRLSRVMPMLALAVTVVAVVAIVVAHQAGNGADRLHAPGARAPGHRPSISAHAQRRSHAVPAPSTSVSPLISAALGTSGTPTHASAAAAVAFEAQGHQLLLQGSYATAVGNLLAAIRDSGQSLVGCIEPASESCLTFAYALYDLGRALRLQGRDSEAIALLSERLRIDNQRPAVQHELELARGASA
jgi:tetratricopeptide (TPR) repeat protein